MTTQQTTWTKFDGSDEQIIELQNAEHGFIIKNIYGHLWKEIYFFWHQCPIGSTHYWLIPDDPLREMKIRQAQTGQPVWVRVPTSFIRYGYHYITYGATTTPDWNIPNANYSFSPFQE